MQKIAMKHRRPDISTGNTVRVHQKIKEGDKERIQIFEGLVIKINSGHGADKTFTVRKVVEGIGVEKIFPLYSTNIEKIEVKKKAAVRRAKLYYMRERSGKSARLKETFVSSEDIEEPELEPKPEQETAPASEPEKAPEAEPEKAPEAEPEKAPEA
ncbi:MAG: 50S ribosomal protein L19 [Candidatus Peregrinibacteria bacterium]